MARENAWRKHSLFIGAHVGAATSVAPVKDNHPATCHTHAGPVDWPSGSMGNMNFGAPCRLLADAGLKRMWGLQMQQKEETLDFPWQGGCDSSCFSMLALRPRCLDDQPSTLNGVICMAYSDEELTAVRAFYQKFKNALLCRLPISHFEAVSWQSLPEVDWVYCVVCSDAAFQAPSYNSPILQSYLDNICMQFKAYGDDFMQELLETTQGWSPYWLDDQPRYIDYEDKDMTERHLLWRKLQEVLPFARRVRKNVATYPANALVKLPELEPCHRTMVKSGPIHQKEIKYFTFGMGSLINTPSRVGTAGVVAQNAIPVRICPAYDFCPCWNFQNYAGGSQLTAGGMVLRTDPRLKNRDAETIGVIYPCPGDEAAMASQDEREVGYTRFNIPIEFIHSLDHWQKVPDGVTVFQYVPNTELPDDHPQRAKKQDGAITPRAPFPLREYPLSQTYIDTCILGCIEHSRKMASEWIQGFIGWPDRNNPHWINDRELPRQPWLKTPEFQIVDTIVAEALPESFTFRKLPAEYGSHYLAPSRCIGDQSVPMRRTEWGVQYTSYVECSRKEVQAAQWCPLNFFFETGLLMPRRNYSNFMRNMHGYGTQAPTCKGGLVVGMPCRVSKEALLSRTHGHRHEGILPSTVCTLVDAGLDGEARDVIGVLYPAPEGWAQPSGEPPEQEKDERAAVYACPHKRVELRHEHLTVLCSWMHVPRCAKVFTYVCTAPEPPSFDYPISQRILDLLLGECLEFGEDFCQEYVDTTDTWVLPNGSVYWLNDRHLARRPWVHLGASYKTFDRIVLESTSACIPRGTLLKRRLAEEYVALISQSGTE